MQHLNKEFRHYLETHLDLTPEEIAVSTPNDIFDMVLAYEGHGEFAGYAIRRWVNLIYDCDLDDLSLATFTQELVPLPGTTDPDWGKKHWGQEGSV